MVRLLRTDIYIRDKQNSFTRVHEFVISKTWTQRPLVGLGTSEWHEKFSTEMSNVVNILGHVLFPYLRKQIFIFLKFYHCNVVIWFVLRKDPYPGTHWRIQFWVLRWDGSQVRCHFHFNDIWWYCPLTRNDGWHICKLNYVSL